MRAKIVKSFARIHKANLINFGIVPLMFANPGDYEKFNPGDTVVIKGIRSLIVAGESEIPVTVGDTVVMTRLTVSERERKMLLAGGILNMA